jgi:SAM-dependent methyltransferase
LPDILSAIGPAGKVHGIDPTRAFVETSRQRAQAASATNAVYEVGDIRAIPSADLRFDATFCEKVLIHAGPTSVALGEMIRVTRPGGRVGALEWLPYFALSSTRPDLVARYNGMLRQATYDYDVSVNLRRRFLDAGLTELRTQAFLAHTTSLDGHPFWRAFLVEQMPMFVHAGLLGAEEAAALVADMESLSHRGAFNAGFIVQTVVGTKPV